MAIESWLLYLTLVFAATATPGPAVLFITTHSLPAHQAKRWLSRPGRKKAVNRTSGSIFVGFGLLLAASSNR